MNITSVFYQFPDQEASIAHLEKGALGRRPALPPLRLNPCRPQR